MAYSFNRDICFTIFQLANIERICDDAEAVFEEKNNQYKTNERERSNINR